MLKDAGRGISNIFSQDLIESAWNEFEGFVNDVGDWFTGGGQWYDDDYIVSKVDECKDTCDQCQFCHDELLCPVEVKYLQKVTRKAFCFSNCEVRGPWKAVGFKHVSECREDVAKYMADLADLEEDMEHLVDVLDEGETQHVLGLKHTMENPGSIQFSDREVSTDVFRVASAGQKETTGLGIKPNVKALPILRAKNPVPLEKMCLWKDHSVAICSTTSTAILDQKKAHSESCNPWSRDPQRIGSYLAHTSKALNTWSTEMV